MTNGVLSEKVRENKPKVKELQKTLATQLHLITYPAFIRVSLAAVYSIELFQIRDQNSLAKTCLSEMFSPDLSRIAESAIIRENV